MPQNAIKYQRTEVDPAKTVSELSEIIRRYGGRRFEQSWDRQGNPTEVRFAIDHPDLGELPVRLVAKTQKIRRIFSEEGLWRSYPDDERDERINLQAYRIAWRHIKDLTEQLLMAVALDLQDLHEAFMGSVEIVDTETGELVRMAEFLERRARQGPEGLVLSPGRRSSPIPLPPAG